MKEQDTKRDLARLGEAVTKNRKYAAKEKDRDMRKQYSKDAADLFKIGVEIAHGNYNRAGRLIYNLDTIVRDQIPVRLYNEIMKNL